MWGVFRFGKDITVSNIMKSYVNLCFTAIEVRCCGANTIQIIKFQHYYKPYM